MNLEPQMKKIGQAVFSQWIFWVEEWGQNKAYTQIL